MELNRQTAQQALQAAAEADPGAWVAHSRYVAKACESIARRCPQLDAEQAYLYGLLHDIGRHAGVSSEKSTCCTATATVWPAAGQRRRRSASPTPL